jgi:hypothetical protein
VGSVRRLGFVGAASPGGYWCGAGPRQAETDVVTLGSVADSGLWVAVLTGGTAVLASWVTSGGNARAARIQAEASARAQHHSRVREIRRTAYLEFIEQAHITGELHWRVGDIFAQSAGPDDQLARIQQVRSDLRDAFDPLMRCARAVFLEGPAPVADAAEAVHQAASEANSVLGMFSLGENGARELFDESCQVFRLHLKKFIETARSAVQDAS